MAMRDADGYTEHDDDAPFPGGSTEAKDAWLADKAAERRRQDADFWTQYGKAAASINMPDAELLAWAGPLVAGRVFATRDILYGYLVNCQRIDLGRPLRDSERHALDRVAVTVWASWRREASVA